MSDPFDLDSTPPSDEGAEVKDDAPPLGEAVPLSQQAQQARAGGEASVGGIDAAAMLDDLNDAQREAVLAEDGALLLLAGAGTGKTRALSTRIAYKIATGQAYPSQVLAVTFTNKAALEMRQRIGSLLGSAVEEMPWLGTFHSLSSRILRRHAELVGLTDKFSILNADDQLRYFKQILKSENIDDKRYPARLIAGIIDRWKNRGYYPDEVPTSEASHFANGHAIQIYSIYQNRLKTLDIADFGDLIMHAVHILRDHKDVLAEYQKKFKHILVDEYQDTNVVQYLWLRLLALGHSNICCVGDDDQSIYGWRGAEIENILRFEKDFAGAKTIKLEQNYRSSPHILAAASGLIKSNEGRLGKTLWTDRKDGEKIFLRGCYDGEEEARLIGDDIEAHHRAKRDLNEISILVRAGFQMREFEDRFITLGLPYRVIGGPRFYERAEIRDANAYLRLIQHPSDDFALERIINRPRRGLGNVALQTLTSAARAMETNLFQAAQTLITTDELKPAARNALQSFIRAVERWQQRATEMTHTELAELVLDESGYIAMWQADKSPEAPGKLENIKEMVSSMGDFENLAGYLEHIALVMEAQSNDSGDEKVSLMTLHAAKGLEFDIVFLPGWEEGVFPHQRSLDEEGTRGLEEERRLAYVGITRAKQLVTISFAGNRNLHGRWINATPSRFIDELPCDHVQVNDDAHIPSPITHRATSATHATPIKEAWQRNPAQTIEGKAVSSSASAAQSVDYKRGERVFHQKFGYGHIEVVDGNKLAIAFDKAGRKKVLADYVEKHG
ncbi:MAG: UvrD-helicase domain-containing protein [Alphaproteobacteria bacterium]|nr:UvrD-helicase domain-containing protein [Alphaproteobacteria bacterium]